MDLRKTISVAAGVSCTLFLGVGLYHIYSRYKRKKDMCKDGSCSQTDEDELVKQLYIRHELQTSHLLIQDGNIPEGVEHLLNVINVSNDPITVLTVVFELMPACAIPAFLEAVISRT